MEDKTLHAVIEMGSKQYLIKVGDKIVTEKVDLKEGETLTVKEVLLTHNGEKTEIGEPYLKNASVELIYNGAGKADKIRVAKFKAKARYRRVLGHRQAESYFTVKSINL